MSSCTRCAVEHLLKRYGKDNVLEIEMPGSQGWKVFDIYAIPKYDELVNMIEFEGKRYSWTMTVFSEAHSRDEDCELPRKRPDTFWGFPALRLARNEAGKLVKKETL